MAEVQRAGYVRADVVPLDQISFRDESLDRHSVAARARRDHVAIRFVGAADDIVGGIEDDNSGTVAKRRIAVGSRADVVALDGVAAPPTTETPLPMLPEMTLRACIVSPPTSTPLAFSMRIPEAPFPKAPMPSASVPI